VKQSRSVWLSMHCLIHTGVWSIVVSYILYIFVTLDVYTVNCCGHILSACVVSFVFHEIAFYSTSE